ncbi:hypothetical protein J2X45_001738 [Caulobacter sp. BE264]|uniref:hypothetical protein n=1 Tax=Caulobacter sp. BE264 TaxID=2817724 RepID=UPI00285BF65C|nr:hypothetical protein [Caulobacter sp. BE264]MDR7230647.1 hypothetical protein [Caulobacter sp. BE264]
MDYADFGRVESLIQYDWKWPNTVIEDPENVRFDGIFGIMANLLDAAIAYSAARRNVTQDIRFCILDSDIENAVAFRVRENSYCIAVTQALFVKAALFGLAFEHSAPVCALFPKPQAKPIIEAHNILTIPREDGIPRGVEDLPAELSFKGFSVGTLMAVAFHELGHIINGHCGYNSTRSVFEFADQGGSSLEDLEIARALEFDADCFAAKEMIGFFAVQPRSVADYLCKDADDHLRFAILATFAFFGALGRNRLYDADWLSTRATHPHPVDRMRLTVAVSTNVIHETTGHSEEKIAKELTLPLLNTGAHAFECVTGRRFDSAGEATGKTYLAFADRASSAWARVRPMLMKTKLGTHNLASAAST